MSTDGSRHIDRPSLRAADGGDEQIFSGGRLRVTRARHVFIHLS